MSDNPMNEVAFTDSDLPTLRRIRDLHRRFLSEPPPTEEEDAVLWIAQMVYTAEFCSHVILELVKQNGVDA